MYSYLLVILFAIGYLNWIVSTGFLSIYIVYVIIVVAQAKNKNKEANKENVDESALNMKADEFLKIVDKFK